MNVGVTDDAAGDLENIEAYIGERDGAAGEGVVDQIVGVIRRLAESSCVFFTLRKTG